MEISAHDDQIPCANAAGQQQCPDGIVHIQIFDQQEIGHHAAREEHGQRKQKGNTAASSEITLGKRITSGNGHNQVEGCAKHGIKNSVDIAREHGFVLCHCLISHKCGLLGQQNHIPLHHFHRIAERGADAVE